MSSVCLVGWPIVAADTDLWYHLTAGRWILEHGAIPRTSFFSFIEPPRPFIDYYWLFQVLVYTLYSGWQYPGLIAFRAAMDLALTVLVLRFLSRGQPRETLPWFAALAVCYGLVLLQRILLVRPHLFTYLGIVALLWLVEFRPRGTGILMPLVGLIWCNVHGVTYPVMGLILVTALLERRHVVPILLTLATVLATPHGLRLLPVPLTSTAGASHYINELIPLELSDLVSFRITLMMPSHQTIANVLLLLIAVAALVALTKRPVPIRQLVLAIGGAVLLTRGARFMYEFLLLSLPLLRSQPLLPTTRLAVRAPKPVYLVGTTLLLLLPLNYVVNGFMNRPAYPFSHADLPEGAVTFLNHVNVGGRVLNDPNPGGYLQWRLYPRYRIYMDMQVPFLFSDEDIFAAQQLFHERLALERALAQYQPDFLIVPTRSKMFPSLIGAFPDYVLVFFDDVSALYVDRRRHPEVAERYALTALDPFVLMDANLKEILADEASRVAMLGEVRRMLSIDPGCGLTHQLVALAYLDDKAYDRALPHAEAIMQRFPEWALGHWLTGDALKGLGQYPASIAAYDRAMERLEPADRPRLYREIAQVYLAMRQYERAYRMLKASVEVYSPKTKGETLYNLGLSARLAGRSDEAELVLRYLGTYKGAPNEAAWGERLKRDLANLQTEEPGHLPFSLQGRDRENGKRPDNGNNSGSLTEDP